MDPITMLTLGSMAAGTAMSLFGMSKSVSAQKQEASIQQQEIGTEEAMNDVREQYMKIQFQRQSIQNTRQAQMMASQAQTTATSGGAQFGSGLAGGIAGVEAGAAWNQLGLSQTFQQGEQMFDLTRQLDSQRIAMSQAQSSASTGQAEQQFGSILSKSSGAIGQLGGAALGMGSGFNFNSLFGGGSPSGYGKN